MSIDQDSPAQQRREEQTTPIESIPPTSQEGSGISRRNLLIGGGAALLAAVGAGMGIGRLLNTPSGTNPSPEASATATRNTPSPSKSATPENSASSSPEVEKIYRPVFEESPLWKNLSSEKQIEFTNYMIMGDAAYMNIPSQTRAQISEFVGRVMKDFTDEIFAKTQRSNYSPLVPASPDNSNQDILTQFDMQQTAAYFLQLADGDITHFGPTSSSDTLGVSWQNASKKVAAGMYVKDIPDYRNTMKHLEELKTLAPDCAIGNGCTNENLAVDDTVTGTSTRREIIYTDSLDGHKTRRKGIFKLTTFTPFDAKAGTSKVASVWQMENLFNAS